MTKFLISVMLLGGLLPGCYGEVDAEPGYVYASPSLAYVSPGVQVVADLDYPVFFADGFYWRYDGGYWYRSPYYNRGWSVSYNVPVGIRGISRPEAYAHYHGGAVVGGYRAPAARGGYRAAPVNRAPAYRAAPPPRAAPHARPAPARGERRHR